MPLNIAQVLHDRVWSMLDGYSPFTAAIREGKYKPLKATTQGYVATRKGRTDPASLPYLTIDVASDSVTNTNEAVTFNDNPQLVNKAIPVRLNLEFVIRHDATSTLDQQTPLESAIRAALLTAGRTLDLGWVSRFTLEGTSRRLEAIAQGGEANFPTWRFRMVVQGMPMRNTLIAV